MTFKTSSSSKTLQGVRSHLSYKPMEELSIREIRDMANQLLVALDQRVKENAEETRLQNEKLLRDYPTEQDGQDFAEGFLPKAFNKEC